MTDKAEHRQRSRFDEVIGQTIGYAGLGTFMGGLLVLSYQCVLWLRDGAWTPLELQLVWHWSGRNPPAVEWQGVQKIIDWFLFSPLSSFLVGLGIILAWLGMVTIERAQNRALAEEKKQARK